MCKVLKVSKSGYYKWLKSGPSKQYEENKLLLEQIRVIHRRSKNSYGSPRITEELREQGFKVSRPRVARLMKKAGIRSKVAKKYVATTDSKHKLPVAGNLLDRNFNVGKTGCRWVSDITYVPTRQGWVYLTIVLDLGDRKVIGWSISHTLKAKDTTVPAFQMAMKNRPVQGALIFHSDQGVQYACREFTALLGAYPQIKQSMSRKGNCWDNAVAESFFKTMKTEWTNHHKYMTRRMAALSMFEYIEAWYNLKRKHSALGYKSPTDFENLLLNRKLAA